MPTRNDIPEEGPLLKLKMKRGALLVLTALMAGALFAGAAEAKKKPKAVQVKVMTRNIFLGADLAPALNSTGFESFIEANGAILREVDQTNFPLRAEGLADEIKSKKPDLIGLQEAAEWRTGPVDLPPTISDPPEPFGAVTVKYDFLQNLIDELAARGMNYKAAVVGTEFDFEAPADYNDVDDDAPPGTFNSDPGVNNESANSLDDAEMNGRLTMRDVILVNKDSKVKAKLKNPQAGHYPNIAGIDLPVTRGWVAGDVTVQKGKGKKKVTKKFRFVNTHFEAFDDETQHPSIRALQAQEVSSGGGTYSEGPASAKKTIFVCDCNSDDDTVVPDDQQAYRVLLGAGFTERSTANPLSCCVSSLFTAPPSEFDHQVDHIMSNQSKKKVKLVNSSVTGLAQANGLYDSDHAGLFSTLKIK
jgi:endonuclease/exonuclease/phosphatase family metal-dependent hydrolase